MTCTKTDSEEGSSDELPPARFDEVLPSVAEGLAVSARAFSVGAASPVFQNPDARARRFGGGLAQQGCERRASFGGFLFDGLFHIGEWHCLCPF